MSITNWPPNERPREKLLLRGPHALSDAELLAIFIQNGIKGKTAVDIAREILGQCGSLQGLLAASREQFCAIAGLGDATYVLLQAVVELGQRRLYERIEKVSVLNNPHDTNIYLASRLRDYEHEVFACLFLDNRHRILRYEELFRGTIDGASVHPREVAKQALHYNAAAVIFAHNHPSGIAEPSKQDEYITRRLKQSLALFDIRVLDHVVVGNGESVSFAERGLI
jgi:DNA repair protein RadC